MEGGEINADAMVIFIRHYIVYTTSEEFAQLENMISSRISAYINALLEHLTNTLMYFFKA